MARPWTEVVADPNFQALAPDAKEAARNAYFQQNVLPNIPGDANASAIRLKFDQDTKPTVAAPAPTVYDASEFKRRVGRDPEPAELANFKATKGVGWAGDPTQGKFTAAQATVGALEDAGSLGTGIVAGVPAGLTYLGTGGNLETAKKVQSALTYAPRSDAGQAGLQGIGQVVSGPGKVAQFAADKIDPTGNLSATLGDVGERAMVVSGILPGVAALRSGAGAGAIGAVRRTANAVVNSVRDPEAVAPTAQGVLDQAAAASQQSQGAAAAAPRVNAASPDLQQAITRTAQKNGGAVNQDALARHLEADSLPVKINLTAGQATQDPVLISQEQNLRGKQSELAQHFNQQNEQLKQNVQAIRDQVGPDVFSTNPVEHGDTLIDAYKKADKATTDKIDAAYQTARDMVSDKTASVVNAPDLLANVTKALHENDLFDSAPKDIIATLSRRAENGSMSFSNIENLRTNLARIQRSISADGNTKYAAGIIRDQIEQAPLTVDNEAVKAAYDNARSLARGRFQNLEADPAYKAAIYETVPADKFVRKFVIGGNRDDVATMAQNLAGNKPAQQTLSVAVLDHLRDAARADSGNFSQAGFNRALQALDPKLSSLVDPKTAEQLNALGNVARYTQLQPRGSFVNNSNTFTAGAADYGAGALEGAANIAAHGIPVGTWTRKALQKATIGRTVQQAIQPGAGLDQLKPLTAYQQMLAAARAKAAQAPP